MAKVLLMDVRTPSHVKTISRILLTGDLDAYEKVVVIAPENLSIPAWPAKLIKYKFMPSSYVSLFNILRFTESIAKNIERDSNVDYLSPINFGPLCEILKAKFHLKNQLLFEDGISSYLNIKVSLRWLKFIVITTITGRFAKISRRKFFSGGDEFSTVIYTDKPLLVRALDLSVEVRNLPSSWSESHKNDISVYLLSSSSVEYGMCSLDRYKKLMKRIGESYAGRSITVSFHHNESMAEEKLVILKSFFHIDRVVERGCAVETDMDENGNMIDVIAPFNSVALNLVDSGKAVRMSLYDDNGPNMSLRKKLFRKINLVSDLEIDIYE